MSKKRVSLTLSEETVGKVDSLADKNGENRSRTVEHIIDSYFSENSLTTAVVFCGDPEAKSLEHHIGKTVIEHVLDHLVENGVEKTYMLSGENQDQVHGICGDKHGQMKLKYISDGKARGTAAALRKIKNKVDETFLAVNGHVITDVDIDEMHKAHREADTTSTIALKSVQNPSDYGAARLKGDKILGFEEKPEEGEEPSQLINAGTYILEPEILERLDKDDIEEIFEELAGERQLSGYIYGGKWIDVSR